MWRLDFVDTKGKICPAHKCFVLFLLAKVLCSSRLCARLVPPYKHNQSCIFIVVQSRGSHINCVHSDKALFCQGSTLCSEDILLNYSDMILLCSHIYVAKDQRPGGRQQYCDAVKILLRNFSFSPRERK